ncbi:MAG: hypothetical protein JWP31_2319 [Aeromicrobium sp.]|nr:hypothetical protein [Aeromicrobium sp.]
MKFRQTRSLGAQANAAVNGVTSRVDGRAGDVAARAARVIVAAVRVLRIPTAVLLLVPLPFIVMTFVLGIMAHGALQVVILVVAALMAAVSGMFWGRRRRIIQAVDDPGKLATELTIMVSLTDKVEETRGALSEIAGGGGWRVFERLRGVWKGAQMTGQWIDQVGDLRRARYFAPPKVGTTVTITLAALWLVPISIVVLVLTLVGTIAGSL